MKKNNLKRFLASLLAVLMLSQVTGVAPGVFAEAADNAATYEAGEYQAPKYHNGTAIIKKDSSDAEVRALVTKAIVENYNDVDPATLSGMEWEYYCTGDRILGLLGSKTKTDWVSINGHTDVTAKATYKFPSLADNDYISYQVRLKGATVEYTLTKADAAQSRITASNEVKDIVIPYTSGTEYDVSALNESIFNAYVTSTTPAGLTYDKLSYTGTVAEGQQTITISYAGDEDHYGANAPVTVNFVDGRNVAFTAKEQPKTLSIGYVGSLPNEEATLAKVREQLINKVGDVDLNQVKIEYNVAFGKYAKLDIAAVLGHVLVATDIKLTYAGDATHKPFTKIFENIKFADNRVASSIVLKENASITYNKEKGAMKQDIFDNAIDWEATKLPEGITKDDLTFECNTSLVPKITVWGDIDGKEYPNLDAGDAQKIRISFVGNSDFKPGEFEFTIKVAKAHVDVSMNAFTKAYAGNEDDLTIEKLGITLNPNDPRIDIYRVFVGINTNLKASVNLVLTDKQWEFIENVSKAQAWLYDKAPSLFPSFNETIQDKLEKGMTIAEFKEYMNNAITAIENAANDETWGPIVQGGLDLFHIDLDAIKALASVFDVLTMVSDDLTIAVGVPKHAGLYRVYAIAANKNYETNFASGTVLILMNWKDIKIVPNADLKKQTITVSEAKEYADGTKAAATLLNKSTGESSGIDQSALHYRFTGLNKIYSSHDFPTAPGKYIVTVSVRGGDYYALPTTFTFTVKAD